MSYFKPKTDPKDEFDPNKVASNEGGLLARLFRTILQDTRRVHHLGILIQRYHDRQQRNNKQTPNIVKIKNKATILTNAKLDSMSIKVFFSLLRDLFCIKWIRLTIELKWPDNKVSIHSVETKLSTYDHQEEGNEDEREKDLT